jgi:DNA (cytosine-5)-methyltransferase 1
VKFLSICSGIEAASVAWEPLGWEAAGFSEIEPFPSAVLAHHYPDVPNLGDMLTLPERILAGEAPAPDLLCGGTPCQAFSVAGNRRSLDDARGNLSLTFCEIANAIDSVRASRGEPSCIVFWENVPGVLNTADNAFGCFLGELAGESVPLVAAGGKWTNAGYVSGPKRAVAWRVLDAQYFGVAQRRRRVFLVASARDGFNPAEILFERAGVRRDFAPSRETGQAVAGTIAARFGISRNNHEECVAHVAPTVTGGPPFSRTGNERVECDALVATTVIGNVEGGAATTLSSREYKGLSCGRDGMTSAAVVYEPIALAIPIHDQATRFAGKRGDKQDGKGNGLGIGEPGAPMNTLTKGDRHAVAHPIAFTTEQTPKFNENQALTLTKSEAKHNQSVLTEMAVRRLTPVECERLQGFPDGYTNIPWRGKPEAPDGPRYKALGNSWAVPNVRWIGARIDQYLKTPRGEVK